MSSLPSPPHRIELEDTLEFINTLEHSRDGDTDHLPTISAAIDWLEAHHALTRPVAMAGPVPMAGSVDLASIHAARSALRAVVDAVVLGGPADPAAVGRVNRLLTARDVPELRSGAGGIEVALRHAPDPIAGALARLAEPLLEVITEGSVERLRICANDECRWAFYDTSRTARRRWCDMTTCGNRAKARRHRERLRETASGGSAMASR
jgi:predicted RNA-binding Zn ribbon-like protein